MLKVLAAFLLTGTEITGTIAVVVAIHPAASSITSEIMLPSLIVIKALLGLLSTVRKGENSVSLSDFDAKNNL